MAESLESLVEKFKITIQKLEEENLEKEATLEAKHQQEIELLIEKEKVEREELEAKQKLDREELLTKQSQRMKDLTVKQHQEKEKSKNDYGGKLKAITENKMCPNTSKKEVPECPVCLESMNPPMRIFQCFSGHYICEDCNNNKEIKSCPTCRQKIVGRNIGMEQAIQLFVAPSDIPSKHQREVVQNQQELRVGSQIDDRGLTCDKCTLINKEGDKFCDACGAPLGILDSSIRPTRKNRPVQSPAHSAMFGLTPGAGDFPPFPGMTPGFPPNGFVPRIPPGFPAGCLGPRRGKVGLDRGRGVSRAKFPPRGFPPPMVGNQGGAIGRGGHQGGARRGRIGYPGGGEPGEDPSGEETDKSSKDGLNNNSVEKDNHMSDIRVVGPHFDRSVRFRPMQLEEDKWHEVVLSSCDGGPTDFCIQLKSSSKNLRDLMETISQSYMRDQLNPMNSHQINAGKPCLAMSADNIIYRAEVLKSDGIFAKVYFLDYGITENLPLNAIYSISDMHIEPRIFSVRCCLSQWPDLSPNDKAIAKDKFEQYSGSPLRCKTVSSELERQGSTIMTKTEVQLFDEAGNDIGAEIKLLLSLRSHCTQFYEELFSK